MNATNGFYVVSYDLKNPGKEYDALYGAIKSLDGEWIHPLESLWLLYTRLTANEISNALRTNGMMDANDLLFVCRLNEQDRQGWLESTNWQWIREKSEK